MRIHRVRFRVWHLMLVAAVVTIQAALLAPVLRRSPRIGAALGVRHPAPGTEPWHGLTPDQQRWLFEGVAYFRRHGFFKEGWGPDEAEVLRRIYDREKERTLALFRSSVGGNPAPSDAELEALWASWMEEENPLNIDPADRLADFQLLKHDRARVWWDDTEADVLPGNRAYVRLLGEFAQMSGGAFRPESVTERWAGPSGPIRVDFLHRGQRVEFSPEFLDDYLDLDTVVRVVNEELAGSSLRFDFYDTGGQDAIVVSLTRDQKEVVKQDRRWHFGVRHAP